jgi:hypothetical protein
MSIDSNSPTIVLYFLHYYEQALQPHGPILLYQWAYDGSMLQ